MPIYVIVERSARVVAVTAAALLLAFHETEAAIGALALWPLTRGAISVLDVFVVFFTERPLIQASHYKRAISELSAPRASD